jgi:xanthine dehydrogenase accessory factor
MAFDADLLADFDRLSARGPVGRGVVTAVWGSAPRPEGACLLATPDGSVAGSVSGGCVEAAVAEEIVAAMKRGTSRLLRYGVTDERAWEVGLACGGTIDILVQPSVPAEVVAAARGPGGVVVASPLEGEELGRPRVVRENDSGTTVPMVAAALDALRHQRSRTMQVPLGEGAVPVFFEVFPRPPRLILVGGVHIAAALVPLARALGYRTFVADGRPGFLTRERFPDADELVCGWPVEAFEKIGLDAATYICILTHDPKFDDPALLLALRSPAVYVGALGSRKTQSARRVRLREAGLTDDQLARLHGPIGLDLGGRGPAETALEILAEMTAVRYGKTVKTEA